MCGINGIFSFSGSRKIPGELEAMNRALAHRGPDAEGVFDDACIQLGHRRLSIIDVSESANQPMHSADGNLVLVFNGELYNYKELKAQLTEYSFVTNSDTEVVLAAFQKWGEHALRAFNGIFAFAIWNRKTQEILIARDRLGVKPLYYFSSNDVFIFSSSLKSILATNRSGRRLSKSGLVDYLRYQTVHAPQTIVEDIQVLMPGQFVRVTEEEGPVFKSYWSLTTASTPRFGTLEETQQALRNQLLKSVEMQLVADVPFGAFLSGGIDSSLLVALMSQVRAHKTDTFSVVFQEDAFSEKKYARLIAEKYQTNHHEIELRVNDFRDLIPEALAFMDHPSGDGPNTFVVSKMTREAGIKMALSGLGGDELFGGYSIFNQLPSLQEKKWLRSFPAYARRPFAGLYRRAKRSVASDKISALMSLEEFDLEHIYQYYRQVFMDRHIVRLLNGSMLAPNRVFEIVHEQLGYRKSGAGLPLLSKISVAEMSTYMQNVLLRDADQMSMSHGLEVRVPFLDHELVELALGIEDRFKRPVTPKKLLVDTFRDLLPEEIYNRPKMGFVLPYEIWMKGDLRNFCEERIARLKESEYFSAPQLSADWNAFLQGSKSLTWSRMWSLVVLSNWMHENNVR